MCFMTFTLGLDLGIVMAKGVIFGVIGCVTILPSMILTFDKAIQKTKHKALIPDLGIIAKFVTNKFVIFIVLFAVIMIPAVYGYNHTSVYYDLAGTLPEELESVLANNKLEEDFSMGAAHMILADSNLSSKDTSAMLNEINNLEGVRIAVGLDNIIGPAIPGEVIPNTYK